MTPLPMFADAVLPPPFGRPLLRMAFRPFYLLAAIAAAVLLPLWIGVLAGAFQLHGGLAPTLWHGHELIFGVVAAVIVGFLFTAGKTWTGLPTPRGTPLLLLAALWLAARITAITGPAPLFSALDIGFLPLCALIFVRLLVAAGNRRNGIVAVVLGMIALANLCFHLAIHGVVDVAPALPLKAGLAGIVLMATLIAGRVIPLFTRNVVPGLKNAVPLWRERLLALATTASLCLWLAEGSVLLASVMLAATGLMHAWRLISWQPLAARGRPILWSLHLAYAWIPLGFLLLAFARASGTPDSAGVHAFAVGATGGLLIAMMTRTARGHTARPLQAGAPETAAYGLVALAAAARVGAVYLPAPVHWPLLVLSAAAFAGGFALFAIVHAPWLSRARLDGKDG
jgi:uncharacterized protein involved in response to NO